MFNPIIIFNFYYQVQIFQAWSDKQISELCDYAKPVIYETENVIIETKDKVDEMLFVVEGKLKITPCHAISEFGIIYVEEGGFCGEELIDGFIKDPDSPDLPISLRTIKVEKEVHAFAIVAEDIQTLIKGHMTSSSSSTSSL